MDCIHYETRCSSSAFHARGGYSCCNFLSSFHIIPLNVKNIYLHELVASTHTTSYNSKFLYLFTMGLVLAFFVVTTRCMKISVIPNDSFVYQYQDIV